MTDIYRDKEIVSKRVDTKKKWNKRRKREKKKKWKKGEGRKRDGMRDGEGSRMVPLTQIWLINRSSKYHLGSLYLNFCKRAIKVLCAVWFMCYTPLLICWDLRGSGLLVHLTQKLLTTLLYRVWLDFMIVKFKKINHSENDSKLKVR